MCIVTPRATPCDGLAIELTVLSQPSSLDAWSFSLFASSSETKLWVALVSTKDLVAFLFKRASTYISHFLWGVLGIGLALRIFKSCNDPTWASPSFSFSSIIALRAFLLGQSRAQCGLLHRKQLVLGVNSFRLSLTFPSLPLGPLLDPSF